MIKAIIIDDEIHCLKTLSILLKEYCPDVQVSEQCDNGEAGIEAIKKRKPDLVFLDIEMPYMNGFEMLEQFPEIPFAVIFTTGYDQYAIKAIRYFSAIKKNVFKLCDQMKPRLAIISLVLLLLFVKTLPVFCQQIIFNKVIPMPAAYYFQG